MKKKSKGKKSGASAKFNKSGGKGKKMGTTPYRYAK